MRSIWGSAGDTFSVVLEDDGKVAYAYLLEHEKVVGDVWLYNVGPAPERPEWKDRSKLPFANPVAYVRNQRLPRLDEGRWRAELAAGRAPAQTRAEVYCGDVLVGQLWPGSKPGRSLLAAKAGPLALPLVEAE